jgi:hypothetical protein
MDIQQVDPVVMRLKQLRNIGPRMAEDLLALGIETPEQIQLADPESLYERLRLLHGGRLDRCVLYAFRGAKYDIPWPACKDPFAPPPRSQKPA